MPSPTFVNEDIQAEMKTNPTKNLRFMNNTPVTNMFASRAQSPLGHSPILTPLDTDRGSN